MCVLEFAVSNLDATQFAQNVVAIVDINVRTSSVLKGGACKTCGSEFAGDIGLVRRVRRVVAHSDVWSWAQVVV